MDTKIISFKEALSQCTGKKHILLGNGFSIACRSEIFLYKNLYESADFSNNEHIKSLFSKLGTYDFEEVIQVLDKSSFILPLYNTDPNLRNSLKDDSSLLKEILLKTICGKHPDLPSEIRDSEYLNCGLFLQNFDCIYTLNYDLLLYWTIMNLMNREDIKIKCNDGFSTSQEKDGFVVWSSENHNTNVYFLHGALHIFDDGDKMVKFTWCKTGIRLIEQIRYALKTNRFPVFVSEGTSKEKMTRINHNAYLSKAYRSFASIAGNLFIYGHSLAENDKHIMNLIAAGKIKNLYVSIFGDENSKNNIKIIEDANSLVNERLNYNPKIPLNITFFRSESAKVWR